MTGRETVESIGTFFERVAPPLRGRLAGIRAQAIKLVQEAVEHAIAQGCTPAEVHAASFARVGPCEAPQGWHERRPTPHTAGKEFGDCLVVLANVAYRAGYDPGREADASMAGNRLRTWEADAEGKAQHVAEGAA
jgi:hypothetical protein